MWTGRWRRCCAVRYRRILVDPCRCGATRTVRGDGVTGSVMARVRGRARHGDRPFPGRDRRGPCGGRVESGRRRTVVAVRSRAIAALAGTGGMASIGLPAQQVTERMSRWAGKISVAAHNSPTSTVVSGDPDALAELVADCDGEAIFARLIPVDYASHSTHVETVQQRLAAELSSITPRARGDPVLLHRLWCGRRHRHPGRRLLVSQPAPAGAVHPQHHRPARRGGPRLYRNGSTPGAGGRDQRNRRNPLRRPQCGGRAGIAAPRRRRLATLPDLPGRSPRARGGRQLGGSISPPSPQPRGVAHVCLSAATVLVRGPRRRGRRLDLGWTRRSRPPLLGRRGGSR